jgi:hypothetical protein
MPDVVCEGGTVGVCRHEGECEKRVEHRVEHNITQSGTGSWVGVCEWFRRKVSVHT